MTNPVSKAELTAYTIKCMRQNRAPIQYGPTVIAEGVGINDKNTLATRWHGFKVGPLEKIQTTNSVYDPGEKKEIDEPAYLVTDDRSLDHTSVYESGMTVVDFLSKGGTIGDLDWDSDPKRHFIEIS